MNRSYAKIQGVRFNVVFCSIGLKSAILTQNWQNMANFEENTPPFVILSKKFIKLVFKHDFFQCLQKHYFLIKMIFHVYQKIIKGTEYNFLIC